MQGDYTSNKIFAKRSKQSASRQILARCTLVLYVNIGVSMGENN